MDELEREENVESVLARLRVELVERLRDCHTDLLVLGVIAESEQEICQVLATERAVLVALGRAQALGYGSAVAAAQELAAAARGAEAVEESPPAASASQEGNAAATDG